MVFCFTAPAQPSATGLPCIRPCFLIELNHKGFIFIPIPITMSLIQTLYIYVMILCRKTLKAFFQYACPSINLLIRRSVGSLICWSVFRTSCLSVFFASTLPPEYLTGPLKATSLPLPNRSRLKLPSARPCSLIGLYNYQVGGTNLPWQKFGWERQQRQRYDDFISSKRIEMIIKLKIFVNYIWRYFK